MEKCLFKVIELSLVVHGTSIRTYLGFTIAHKYWLMIKSNQFWVFTMHYLKISYILTYEL